MLVRGFIPDRLQQSQAITTGPEGAVLRVWSASPRRTIPHTMDLHTTDAESPPHTRALRTRDLHRSGFCSAGGDGAEHGAAFVQGFFPFQGWHRVGDDAAAGPHDDSPFGHCGADGNPAVSMCRSRRSNRPRHRKHRA